MVLHDSLLRPTNLGRLSEVLGAIVRDQDVDDDIIASWLWLPRDMNPLADTRNNLAHMPGPWKERPKHDRTKSVRLLGKVHSGTVDLWGTLCFPDSTGLTRCDEAGHAEDGDRLVSLLQSGLDAQGL